MGCRKGVFPGIMSPLSGPICRDGVVCHSLGFTEAVFLQGDFHALDGALAWDPNEGLRCSTEFERFPYSPPYLIVWGLGLTCHLARN